jgi:hypothetical protein
VALSDGSWMSAAWPLLEAKRTSPGLTAKRSSARQNAKYDADGAGRRRFRFRNAGAEDATGDIRTIIAEVCNRTL